MLLQPAARVALSRHVFAQAEMAATSPSMEPVCATAEAMKARTRAWENCMVAVGILRCLLVGFGRAIRILTRAVTVAGDRQTGATGLFIGIRGGKGRAGGIGGRMAERVLVLVLALY
jgi:hypothetical protein